jgi:dienelactone hydrolase
MSRTSGTYTHWVSFLKSKSKFWLIILVLCALPALAPPASGQDLVEQKLRIPAPGAGKEGLEAVMVRPNDARPHPLALLNHGAPRSGSERRKMTPWEMLPQAREFARRGWTTVIVMRRGYGDSGGNFAEDSDACGRNQDYYGSGVHSANDLRAAIAYLSKLSEVDPTRVISVGRSAGGFATVALTANPPPGLVAAISFAGGRGSPAKDKVCNSADLVDAFRAFGKKSRIPMLWVYAQNDHYFSPELAGEFYRAFTAAGGKAQFVSAGPFSTDGHALFSLGGIRIWPSIVDDFLKTQNLVLRQTLLALPEPPAIDPPTQLSASGISDFRRFLTFPTHRAFAVSPSGQFGYTFGVRTEKDAKQMAEDRCNSAAGKKERCTLYIVDNDKPLKQQAR